MQEQQFLSQNSLFLEREKLIELASAQGKQARSAFETKQTKFTG